MPNANTDLATYKSPELALLLFAATLTHNKHNGQTGRARNLGCDFGALLSRGVQWVQAIGTETAHVRARVSAPEYQVNELLAIEGVDWGTEAGERANAGEYYGVTLKIECISGMETPLNKQCFVPFACFEGTNYGVVSYASTFDLPNIDFDGV